jgi:hypothetical protein
MHPKAPDALRGGSVVAVNRKPPADLNVIRNPYLLMGSGPWEGMDLGALLQNRHWHLPRQSRFL